MNRWIQHRIMSDLQKGTNLFKSVNKIEKKGKHTNYFIKEVLLKPDKTHQKVSLTNEHRRKNSQQKTCKPS